MNSILQWWNNTQNRKDFLRMRRGKEGIAEHEMLCFPAYRSFLRAIQRESSPETVMCAVVLSWVIADTHDCVAHTLASYPNPRIADARFRKLLDTSDLGQFTLCWVRAVRTSSYGRMNVAELTTLLLNWDEAARRDLAYVFYDKLAVHEARWAL